LVSGLIEVALEQLVALVVLVLLQVLLETEFAVEALVLKPPQVPLVAMVLQLLEVEDLTAQVVLLMDSQAEQILEQTLVEAEQDTWLLEVLVFLELAVMVVLAVAVVEAAVAAQALAAAAVLLFTTRR
jgi:hypothetical protein